MGAGKVMAIWSGAMILGADRATAGAECVSGRGVERGIHQPLHGEGNVLGGKRGAVGKRNAGAELESDLFAVLR